MKRGKPERKGIAALALTTGTLVLLTACGSVPTPRQATFPAPAKPSSASHSPVVEVALSLVGIPYRYGGASLRGMDCSGLVHYTYLKVGVTVPRTVEEQRRHAFPVSLNELQPGDLLFFRLDGRRISHVGIYLGGKRFIHAPRTGKHVSIAYLNDIYWNKRLAAAGRFY